MLHKGRLPLAGGLKPNTRPVATGRYVLGEHVLLLNPQHLCLSGTMCIHRAHLSPASSPGSGRPRGSGDVLLWGCPKLGQRLPTSSTHQLGSGRAQGSVPPTPPLPATEGVPGR